MLALIIGIGFVAIIIAALSVKICKEYERGVIFRLGRYHTIKGPGLFLIIPFIDSMRRIDLRTRTYDVPSQEIVTKDNVSAKVDAIIYFKVVDPRDAVIEVEDFFDATTRMGQTLLRSILGKSHLDDLIAKRERIADDLLTTLDEATNPWGIKVTNVEIRNVELTEEMVRALARQAESERRRRARVILAKGEKEASETLEKAGKVLRVDPVVLRYLQTLSDAAKERNTTILFPYEIIKALIGSKKKS